MHKTEALKLAEEKPREEEGAGHDGRGRPPPLRNALHPLEELATGYQWHTRDRAISKPRPVELSVMGTAQRPLPEDERTAGSPAYGACPLLATGCSWEVALTSSDQNSVFCEHQEIHM